MRASLPFTRSQSHTLQLLVAAGLAWFLTAAVLMHLLRADLDPVATTLSVYLIGAWGPLLQSAYLALGMSMAGLALGIDRSLSLDARSAAPLLLIVLAGISLGVTAFARTDLYGAERTLEGVVHGVSAQAAFLFTTTGLCLLAARLRLDPAWERAARRWLLPWSVACFTAVWILAWWRELPRGLAQKTVVAMIFGWLVAALVMWARRGRSARG